MAFLPALRPAPPLRAWVLAAMVVLVGSIWNAVADVPDQGVVVLLATGASIVLASRSALVGLGLLVAAAVAQVVAEVQVNPAQALAGVTFYSIGRNGSRGQHRLAVGAVGLLGLLEAVAAVGQGSQLVESLLSSAGLPGGAGVMTAAVAGGAVLVVPLVIGVAEQARAAARTDEAARRQAEEELAGAQVIAAVEAERARLARDVHDTVGHALTVVITQTRVLAAVAERDPAQVVRAAATVEQVASAALEEVRGVLAGAVKVADITVEDLAELAGSTDRVRVGVTGALPPLAGEVGEAAYRVVQELVTNALRHGDPAEPVEVSIGGTEGRAEFEVRNAVVGGAPLSAAGTPGSGLDGLRVRLDAVDGALTTAVQDGSWLARAVIPLGERE